MVDNDQGSTTIFNKANKFLQKKDSSTGKNIEIKNNDDFFHLYSNLYLIKTPCVNEENESCIEDLFDQGWLSKVQHNGRRFSKKNNFDNSKYFGKKYLATRVLPKSTDIDFKGFKPLLDRIVKLTGDFSQNGRS